MTQNLEARIRAHNRATKVAKEIYPKLRSVFEQFVGQRIRKVDGDLLVKIKKLLPNLENDKLLTIYRESLNYSLAWTVKACEQVKGAEHCVYEQTTVYIGDLADGHLTKLSEPPNYRDDYTLAEMLEKRRKFKQKKAEFEEARTNLFPFGEIENDW